MEEYLRVTKAALASGVTDKIHAVLGNEACDLDSAVSALTYAYYLHTAHPRPDTTAVAVLNILRADLSLRTEVTYHLKRLAIDLDHLTCRDEIDLAGMCKDSKLALTLVDHNVLSATDNSLEADVVEVIDHRKRERPERESEEVTMELVGSCCTLVAEKLLNNDNFHIDHQVAELLYGPIVLDTINLSDDAGIKTPKDVSIIERLEMLRPEVTPARGDIYSTLCKARADVSALTSFDILRKDMKVVTSSHVKVAFSSVPIELQTLLSREDIVTSLSTFSNQQGAAAVVLMSLTISGSGEPQRHLAVYSEDTGIRQQVSNLLKSFVSPSLELSPITSLSDQISVFVQGNVVASRKKILPQVLAHIDDTLPPTSEHELVSTPSADSGVVDLSLLTSDTLINTPSDTSQLLFPASDSTEHSIIDHVSDDEDAWILPNVANEESLKKGDNNSDSFLSNTGGSSDKVPTTGDELIETTQETASESSLLSDEATSKDTLLESYEKTPLPDVIHNVENLSKSNYQTAIDNLPLAGITSDDTTSDGVLVEVERDTLSPDSIPESTKPGGLLDLDLFSPKQEIGSDSGSIESLQDYGEEHDIKDIPLRSEQEVLDLICDALKEDQKLKTPTPPHTPVIGDVGNEKDENTIKSDIERRAEIAACQGAGELLDPFEYNEGVLIQASPVQGMTPEHSITPDNTSEPISPQTKSYPGTPPNSYIDSSNTLDTQQSQRDLPSFMNADMVRRIHEKKAALYVIDEKQMGENLSKEEESYPFVPQNSVSDSTHEHLTRQQNLPSFDNAEMVKVVHQKRAGISEEETTARSEAMTFPYTPPNSFVDNSFIGAHVRGDPLHLIEEDFAERMNKKEHNFSHGSDQTSPLEEIAAMELPTKETGNVVAYRIAQEMKKHDNPKITDLPKDFSENVFAPQEPQSIITNPAKSIWEENTRRYSGEDEIDVANQLTAEVLQNALADIGMAGESLQAELARANLEDSDEEMIQLVPASISDSMNEMEQEMFDNALSGSSNEHQSKSLAMLVQGSPLEEPAQYESLSNLLPCVETGSGVTFKDQDSSTSPRHRVQRGSVVKFAEPIVEEKTDFEGRPHSDSQLSVTSTGADSDLSQNTKDFLERLRSDTGASILSDNSEDLMVAARQLDLAQVIVDVAIDEAVDIVSRDKHQQETLTHHGEWDAEHHKATMDQLPEQHVSTMDTKMSTPMEVDEEGNRMLPQRPLSLQSTPKKRIVPNLDLLQDQQLTEPGVLAPASISSSDGDILDSFTDLHTPDDLNTPEVLGDSVFEGELDWEDKRQATEGDVSEDTQVDPIPEYTAREEFEDEKNWRTVTVGDRSFRIDMKVIEPYKRVLSHGGYYGDGFNAIIVFTGYYLPDKRRRDYHYVMDNLFLYVLSTLELLVVEDYMVVFFHGATPKQRMPSLRWLKRCYEMIDRRLRKNLKSLLIVHPTLWIKTIVTLTKPFISSKFSSKLKYIRGLKELAEAVPMEYIFVPDEIKMFDEAKFTQSAPAAT